MQNNVATISIVIPTFNRGKYVVAAIESVLAQTDPDWELIIVDDGSTDLTSQYIQPYKGRPSIQYLYQPNSGRSVARNLGVSHASGEWVLFLDSDDLLLPDALKTLRAELGKSPQAGLVTGQVQLIDDEGKVLGEPEPIPADIKEFAYPHLVRAWWVLMGSFLVKKSLTIGQPLFVSSLEPCEDYDFLLRVALLTPFAIVQAPVVQIRRHPGNTEPVVHRAAGIRVAKKHLELLRVQRHLRFRLRRQVACDLRLNISDYSYIVGTYWPALGNFCLATLLDPLRAVTRNNLRRLLKKIVPRRMRASLRLRAC